MDTQGGRITLDINGQVFDCRGKATIHPARAVPENGVNWSGKGYSMVKPKLASAEMSYDRGQSFVWTEDMLLGSLNVTIVEPDAGRIHYFTNARWSGEPIIDTESGEVTGLKIESDLYRSGRI